jgi:formylmethanofuran dehydrogenase subunit E
MHPIPPKQRDWSNELYEKASEFHGHDGLFMAAGLRMGLTALNILDVRGWFGITCVAKLRWSPPDSCIIDGLQFSSGCTMGKHNISVEEREGVSAEFESGGNRVVVILRDTVLSLIRESLEEDVDSNRVLKLLSEAPDVELFEVLHNGVLRG